MMGLVDRLRDQPQTNKVFLPRVFMSDASSVSFLRRTLIAGASAMALSSFSVSICGLSY
jgi:hypothetical protein